MVTHPLDCSIQHSTANFFSVMSQSLRAPRPFAYGFAALTSPLILSNTRLMNVLFYPSNTVNKLAGSNKNIHRKISWLAPALGISIMTLAGRAMYEAAPNSFLKGAVFGWNSYALGLLTNIPFGDWAGLITLRKVFATWLQLPSALQSLSSKGLFHTEKRSEILASVTFFVSSFGLGFFRGMHPVTANTVGHVAAAATKVISARAFALFAEKRNPQLVHRNLA